MTKETHPLRTPYGVKPVWLDLKCDHCGGSVRRRSSQVLPRNFCSLDHRNAWMASHHYRTPPKARPCKHCHTEFVPTSSKKRYCSRECCKIAFALSRASKTHDFICYCCGVEFEKYAPSLDLIPSFCSTECRLIGTREFWERANRRRDKIMAHRKREREALEVGTIQLDHKDGGAMEDISKRRGYAKSRV